MSRIKFIAAAALASAALYASPAYAAGVEGKWDIVAKTDFGEFKSAMTVAQDGDAYTVAMVDAPPEAGAGGPGGGGPPPDMQSTFSDVSVDGDMLTFKRNITGGFEMTLTYSLTIEGDMLTGTANSDFGPMPITGTRAE